MALNVHEDCQVVARNVSISTRNSALKRRKGARGSLSFSSYFAVCFSVRAALAGDRSRFSLVSLAAGSRGPFIEGLRDERRTRRGDYDYEFESSLRRVFTSLATIPRSSLASVITSRSA